jgi:hypothetical protein
LWYNRKYIWSLSLVPGTKFLKPLDFLSDECLLLKGGSFSDIRVMLLRWLRVRPQDGAAYLKGQMIRGLVLSVHPLVSGKLSGDRD